MWSAIIVITRDNKNCVTLEFHLILNKSVLISSIYEQILEMAELGLFRYQFVMKNIAKKCRKLVQWSNSISKSSLNNCKGILLLQEYNSR